MANECPKCKTYNPEDSKFCKECATPLPGIQDAVHTKTLETPKEELTTGSTFAGRYQVIEELGEGGMGRVYKVLDKETKERIALKLIKAEIASDKKTIERFKNELITARKIRNKNVCGMYYLGEDNGRHYITMEFVSGEDLKSSIRRFGNLPIGKAISIAEQICDGLEEAHSLGIVHRDLKPNNIMIDDSGNARIMDFGIARTVRGKGITGSGVMIGTPEYMSPEQAEAGEIDSTSDIYSLGVILYEITTGRLPFEGDTALVLAMKHKSAPSPDPKDFNPSISEDLSYVILKCLAKEKKDRYKNAKELFSALSKVEKGLSTSLKASAKPKTKKKEPPARKWQNSIAVLPFADLSPQKDQEYFCDGMSEEIINSLTKIEDFKVVARTSAFSFKEKDVDVREIGEKLNVNTVLEGSIRKAGNRLRINTQLIDVKDGYHIWSERFDRELEDVFAIQDEISLAIVEKLKVKFLGKRKDLFTRAQTENMAAYNLYLEGLHLWNSRVPEKMRRGTEKFQRAMELDPTYPLPYIGLANSLNTMCFWGQIPHIESSTKARALVRRALEIDDTLAEAYTSQGFIHLIHDWDWPAAEKSFEKAIELNPNYSWAHFWYGMYFLALDRPDESLMKCLFAMELDPLSHFFESQLIEVTRESGKTDEAISLGHRAIERNPTFGFHYYGLTKAYIDKRMYKKAEEICRKGISLGTTIWMDGYLLFLLAKQGQREKAEKHLKELEDQSKQRYIPMSGHLLFFHLGLGEIDESIYWLNKIYEEKFPVVPFLRNEQIFCVIYDHPKFRSMINAIGLEDWKNRPKF